MKRILYVEKKSGEDGLILLEDGDERKKGHGLDTPKINTETI